MASVNDDLFQASKTGKIDDVRQALVNGADINFKSFMGWTPLHAAAGFSPNLSVLKYLLSAGADLNSKDNSGRTALHLAAKGGKNDRVLELLQNGANVNMQATNGFTPLAFAVLGGNLSTCQMLLQHGADSELQSNDGRTPLSMAEEKGHKKIEALLKGEEIPEDPMDPQMAQLTAMMSSITQMGEAKKQMIEEAQRRGIDTDSLLAQKREEQNSKAKKQAVVQAEPRPFPGMNCQEDQEDLSIQSQAPVRIDPQPFPGMDTQAEQETAWRVQLEDLGFGRYADAFDDIGFDDPETWPHMTDQDLKDVGLKRGHIVKWRLRFPFGASANPEQTAVETDSVTELSVVSQLQEILATGGIPELSTQAKPAPEEKPKKVAPMDLPGTSTQATTANERLFQSAKEGDVDGATSAVEAGADLNHTSFLGWTPLHAAAGFSPDLLVLKLLIALGADLNAKDNSGRTPLHLAAKSGKDDKMLELLQAGSNLEAKANNGHTPLMVAVLGQKFDTCEILMEQGADLDARDNLGRTALNFAQEKGLNKIEALLKGEEIPEDDDPQVMQLNNLLAGLTQIQGLRR